VCGGGLDRYPCDRHGNYGDRYGCDLGISFSPVLFCWFD
jgi:hypothetical protein